MSTTAKGVFHKGLTRRQAVLSVSFSHIRVQRGGVEEGKLDPQNKAGRVRPHVGQELSYSFSYPLSVECLKGKVHGMNSSLLLLRTLPGTMDAWPRLVLRHLYSKHDYILIIITMF